MPNRVGIELSSSACRIVEVESGPVWRRDRRDTRVRSFAVLPPDGPQTRQALTSFSGRRAAAVVWGAASEHRQVVVNAGSYETMRAEAVGSLAAVGVETRGMLADITPVASSRDPRRRSVAVALASGAAVYSAIQPLIDAGIRVRTVMTPPTALTSLMRMRPARMEPGAIEAYVALDETAASIALMRDGGLLVTRTLPWGYLDGLEGRQPMRREDVALRLADELAEFFLAAGGSTASVKQVCICGGHPELRSLTIPLMETLDLEVEPLDSLFGIDASRMPGAGSEFQDRIVELRLAWAAVADWPPPLNLLRARNRRVSRAVLSRAAVVAGMAAGWGLGWRIASSPSWRYVAPAKVTRTAAAVAKPRAEPPPAPSPQPVAPAPPFGPAMPPPIVRAEPPVPAPLPTMLTSPAAQMRSVAPVSRRVVRDVVPPVPRPQPPSGHESIAAFDAVLGTILYSSDRRLAIVDGRIVGLGDEVRGARVVEIGPSAVILRDGQGRLRRLALGATGR